jgi:excisionase family DNA binding protein
MENQMEYLTVSETARLLNVNPATVRRWINSGKLVCVRLPMGRDNAIRISRDAIEALLHPSEAHVTETETANATRV